MNPDDLLLLVTRTMPFGKYKDRLIADLPEPKELVQAFRDNAWTWLPRMVASEDAG